jgi:hypothetical protein
MFVYAWAPKYDSILPFHAPASPYLYLCPFPPFHPFCFPLLIFQIAEDMMLIRPGPRRNLVCEPGRCNQSGGRLQRGGGVAIL